MQGGPHFTIKNETKGKLPRLPFVRIKEKILGKKYELDFVFVTPERSKMLNLIYREKNKPTNVLAFPLSASAGHIIICPEKARVEAPEFDKTPLEFIGFLFIHALLHLKGLTHGSRMESEERKFYALLMRGSSPSRIHGKKNMRRN